MPRTESRTPCAIWDRRDWTSLTIDCQWFYQMIKSQFGVSHAGVLLIPRREWTNLASDEDIVERLAHARKICEERGYLAIDENTDEVLIRTYLRTDIISGPPGTFRAAMDAVCAVRSPKLRTILRGELLRLDVSKIEQKGSKVHRETPLEAYHRALAALGAGPDGGHQAPPAPASVPVPEPTEHGIPMASRRSQDAMPQPRGCHPDGIGDAPVVVDVVVDVAVGTPEVEIKEAAAPRASAREQRVAHVRAAQLVVATLPRTLGNYVTREALQKRLGDRLLADSDGALTDEVIKNALTRWVATSKVAPAAIDWMLDDAIKESAGGTPVRRRGRMDSADIFAAGRDLVSRYEAEEADTENVAPVHRLNRGVS